jgi:myo-inositol-1(or 4)-monophosphatase
MDDAGTTHLARTRALMPALRTAVREAGALALPAFRAGAETSARVWFKAGHSPVTEADLAVDAFLKERLGALLPEAGWLSEESVDAPDRLGTALTWIVDPIDGTRAFSSGHPDWSISVGLVAAGRPLAGLVYAPAHGHFYEALAGDGARLDGAPIRVSDQPGLAGARVAGPKPLVDRIDRGLGLAGESVMLRLPKVPSLALRLARVAAGTIDVGLVGGQAHDWDLAGADLILHEAGGAMTDAAGKAPTYNRPEPVHRELVAASVPLHALAREALAKG